MRILHLDSSILASASASRALTGRVVDQLRAAIPAARIVYRDLVAEPIAHLSGPIAAGFRPLGHEGFDAATLREHALSETLVGELLASDVVVIGAPMYNFSVSSQLKAWIDRVVQPGRTFKYTPTGPIGLAGDKRVIVVSTRGGVYTEGPMAALDFQERYLAATFGFMGIGDVHFVRAESLSKGPDASALSMQLAQAAIGDAVRAALRD